MHRIFFLFLFCLVSFVTSAQGVEVQANYNSVGDVDFVAYNNTPAPIYLNIDFADLENTTFLEELPYMKMIAPGFNTLFTLYRDPDAGLPRFNYQIRTFRSNPMALPDLEFPYLIPFTPGKRVSLFDVKELLGFWGSKEPASWNATGFVAEPGEALCFARTGIIVEIAGEKRTSDPQLWYHTWNHAVTVLQADGTLLCYRNVVADSKLKAGMRVVAGQSLGTVTPGADELILLIFQHNFSDPGLRFVIPQFVIDEKTTGVLLTSQHYTVTHPNEVRGREMTNKEKRRKLK